nr:GNAT family N-acetyltransferase [Notoacmeibacter sp. MSK16QG-6]
MAGYRKQLRYDLRRGHDLRIERSDDAAAFHHIYTENMRRVGASAIYHFSADYLAALCSLPGAELWLAHDAEGVATGGIFLRQGEITYYHLGATADRAIAASPLKHLLHNRIATLAMSGSTRLVLGGGRAGADDALLRFKRGFSRLTVPVHALRVILDPKSYARLSGLPVQPPPANGFFPTYRAP